MWVTATSKPPFTSCTGPEPTLAEASALTCPGLHLVLWFAVPHERRPVGTMEWASVHAAVTCRW